MRNGTKTHGLVLLLFLFKPGIKDLQLFRSVEKIAKCEDNSLITFDLNLQYAKCTTIHRHVTHFIPCCFSRAWRTI